MAVGTAGGGRAESTYFARAIVDSRSTLHLSYRLAVRYVQWTAIAGAAGPGSGVWRAALPLFVVLDLVTWQILRHNTRFGLRWRLALDCADVAFWSLSPLPPSRTYDNAVLIGIPLSIEAGFRMGTPAVVVPLAVAAVVGPVRMLAGAPAHPLTALWLVLGMGLGMALFSYCRRLDAHAEAERRRRRSADARWAFLVGQNAVAMGADSVVDVIEGLVPVLGRPGRGSALWRLADGWKARLAADVAPRPPTSTWRCSGGSRPTTAIPTSPAGSPSTSARARAPRSSPAARWRGCTQPSTTSPCVVPFLSP
jgi:hypothetical protein